jgi:hypothetical protein
MKTPAFIHSPLEVLEDRIAPALLVNGANLLGGAGNPSTGETSVGENAVTLVKVLSGQALVWYDDGNIEAISFGPNTSLEITGNVLGDLVGNLRADGTLSDSDADPLNGEDGSRLLANNLVGLKTLPLGSQKGSVHHIITGGAVSGLTINGAIEGVYAGDGAFRPESDLLAGGQVVSTTGTLDINPVEFGTQTTFTFTKAGSDLRAGASISSLKIADAPALQLIAGSGNPTGAVFTGAGPAGGSIVGVTIESAYVPAGSPANTPSYTLIAGDGANGKTGGAGGAIDRIVEKASFGPVLVQSGAGGDGNGGAGGNGGAISNLDLQSNSARYTVTAGDGGDGAPAGAGGKLSNNNFSNRTPVSGLVLAADFTGDGKDDVLVIDAATGQMIVSQATGATFTQVVQYAVSGTDVVLIDSAGVNPVDAEVRDVDGDSDMDVIVAYKNSGSLGVFLNQGGGVFFDPSAGTAGEFASAEITLGFAPAHLAVSSSGTIAISENVNGTGVLRYGVLQTGASADDLALELSTGSNVFAQPLADLVVSGGDYYAGFTNGVIARLQTAGLEAKKAFAVFDTGVAIPGGLNDLEIDSTGNRLLALSTVSRSVSVFSTQNSTLTTLDTIALGASGKSVVAHFLHDADSATEDGIAVLTTLPGGTRIDSFEPAPDDGNAATIETFSAADTLTTSLVLKNFAGVYADTNATDEDLVGLAGLAGSMSQFTFTPDYVSTAQYALPFASKQIELRAGDGGTGLNLGPKLIGKGGAGGSIVGINADANEIRLYGGAGGASGSGAAGAGGSVANGGQIITTTGTTLTPALLADVVLEIEAGDGGTPTGPEAKTATGGAGGSLSGLQITLEAGDITLTTGQGGHGFGGNGGAGGSITGVKTLARDGSLALSTGDGGDATGLTGAGGAGGSIVSLQHELALEPDVESLEKAYSVSLSTGDGGAANGGAGGAGGSIAGATLKLDGSDRTYDDATVNPPLADAHKDNTVAITVTAGDGGNGTSGGAGGSIRDLRHESVHDQVTRSKQILTNYVTMTLTAGDGGVGSAGQGGAGGSILLSKPISGLTVIDPDSASFRESFRAYGGVGGAGSVKGGAGGSISGITLQNAPSASGASLDSTQLHSALIVAGAGGAGGTSDGGAGGAVSKLLVGVQNGWLTVAGGDGGAGGTAGKGGAGGAISASTLGLVRTTASLGLLVEAGAGGAGTLGGGAGGGLTSLQLSTPQSTSGISAILAGGDGGAANSAGGVGGKGGSVAGISQIKDVNSSLNVIAAGSGGDNALGLAGAGGSVTGVKTVGFIGRPSDGVNRLGVFDQLATGGGGFLTIPQGVFAGTGGQGVTDGANGSVSAINARQIAAIAAYNGSTNVFAAAAKVSVVKANVIGFDVNADGVFESTVGSASPTAQTPIDGFILAAAIQQVSVLPPASFIFAA